VALFRPACLFPNTVYDSSEFLDYFILPCAFRDQLSKAARQRTLDRAKQFALTMCARKHQEPPQHAISATLRTLHEIAPRFGTGIANANILNFAGPDHFEREMREILEPPPEADTPVRQLDDAEANSSASEDTVRIARDPPIKLLRKVPNEVAKARLLIRRFDQAAKGKKRQREQGGQVWTIPIDWPDEPSGKRLKL
jgi:hypothetical protein